MARRNSETVSLVVGGEEFTSWSDLEIKLSIDAFSSVAFSAPFEAERAEFKEVFRPFSYLPVDLLIAKERAFTGTLIDIDPKCDDSRREVQVTAYSKPAVLEDCTPAEDSYPLEWNNLGLRAIGERLCKPFGIIVRFEAPEGAKFARAACDPDRKIHDFLADLARQRGLVISSTANGEILFRRSTFTGSPVARLRLGEPPLTVVSSKFSPRNYYSQLTGIGPSGVGKRGHPASVKNPRLVKQHTKEGRGGRTKTRELIGLAEALNVSVLRPLTVKLDDTESADVPHAIQAKLGRMFGCMCSYTCERLPTWRDPSGRLWQPNTTIMLTAPDAMIYSEYEFTIRNVTLRQDADGHSATLELMLPGSFSGEIPGSFPWDG